jgi:hypothetical protein
LCFEFDRRLVKSSLVVVAVVSNPGIFLLPASPLLPFPFQAFQGRTQHAIDLIDPWGAPCLLPRSNPLHGQQRACQKLADFDAILQLAMAINSRQPSAASNPRQHINPHSPLPSHPTQCSPSVGFITLKLGMSSAAAAVLREGLEALSSDASDFWVPARVSDFEVKYQWK